MITRIKEIFKWRELLFSLVLKDLKIKYRQAAGGFGWMLVMPLAQAVIFTFIFRFLFGVRIENYPLFLLSGLLPWSFLRSSLDSAANSILTNANLIKKAYFPREIFPLSNIAANSLNLVISLGILAIFSILFKIPLFPAVFWLPAVILIQIILIIGISLFLAGLNTVYRDAQFMMDILLLVWFYATPIVYPLEMVKNIFPAYLFFLYSLNPMAGIISAYQSIFIYAAAPNIELLIISFLSAILFFSLGFIVFRNYEEIFADIV